MNLEAIWQPVIELRNVPHGYAIDLDELPDDPAVYMICRRFGSNTVPLYIGQTIKLKARMKQHFDSVKFMQALDRFPQGARCLAWARVYPQGLKLKKTLSIIERGLIAHVLAEGHELINIKGTRTPTHDVSFNGALEPRKISGMKMYVEK